MPFRATRAASILAAAACLAASLALAQADGAGSAGPSARPAAVQNRLVIQVSDADPGKWNLALNNARNIQTDLGAANVDIEIVAYGPGIGMLKIDSPVASRIDNARGAGVKVIACENTMRGQKLAKSDMLNGIGYVQAGVVEIMQKQQQGWSYLRP